MTGISTVDGLRTAVLYGLHTVCKGGADVESSIMRSSHADGPADACRRPPGVSPYVFYRTAVHHRDRVTHNSDGMGGEARAARWSSSFRGFPTGQPQPRKLRQRPGFVEDHRGELTEHP